MNLRIALYSLQTSTVVSDSHAQSNILVLLHEGCKIRLRQWKRKIISNKHFSSLLNECAVSPLRAPEIFFSEHAVVTLSGRAVLDLLVFCTVSAVVSLNNLIMPNRSLV